MITRGFRKQETERKRNVTSKPSLFLSLSIGRWSMAWVSVADRRQHYKTDFVMHAFVRAWTVGRTCDVSRSSGR